MIKCLFVIVLTATMLVPSAALSGEDEKKALMSYFSGDLSHLVSLLAHDFRYEYFDKGKLKTLNREEDLRALARLLKDTIGNTVGSVHQLEEDIQHAGRFRVKFSINFEDSPKVYTDSFFRGDELIIEEVFVVTLEEGKIGRIAEIKEKRTTNRLLFGNLKTIYLKDVITEWSKDHRESKLFDKDNHELIVWKKLRKGEGTECFYYWPNNRLVDNFWYSP